MKRDQDSDRSGGAWANALLLVFSLAASFLAFEILVRWTGLGDRMGGASVPTVAERLAGIGPPNPGVPRILALGDSFTVWRDNTGASYPRVAVRALAKQGVDVDLVNLAEGGSGPKEYLVNLLRHGKALAPDLVIIGVYLGNDLFITDPPLDTPQGVAVALGGELQEDVPWWKQQAKHSLALTYTWRLLKLHFPIFRSGHFERITDYFLKGGGLDQSFLAERLANVPAVLIDRAKADAINPWDLVGAIFSPDHFGQLARMESATGKDAQVEGGLKSLGVIIGECRRQGVPVMAVLLPPPVWVSSSTHAYFRDLGHRDLGSTQGPVPVIERLKAFMAERQVPVLDVLPDLRAASHDVYLAEDEHLNADGQRLVGEALVSFLTERGLVAKAGERER